jgi:hypothetical protein
MAELKDVVWGWRDAEGVRNYSNVAPADGATVTSRYEARRPDPEETAAFDAQKLLDEALEYDVTGAVMKDFGEKKQELFQHTFGGQALNEASLNPRQQALWRKNVHKLHALLEKQHVGKREAMLKKYEVTEAKRREARGDRQASEAMDVGTRLRTTVEQLMTLKDRAATDPRAAEEYDNLYKKARVYEALAGKGRQPLNEKQVESIMDITASEWGAMSPEDQKAHPGGYAEFMRQGMKEADKILGTRSLLGQLGLGPRDPGAQGGGPSGPGADVKDALRAAAPVIKAMPPAQQKQVAARIDAAAAKAKQTGDSTELLSELQALAGVPPTAPSARALPELAGYLEAQTPRWNAEHREAQAGGAPSGRINLGELITNHPSYLR